MSAANVVSAEVATALPMPPHLLTRDDDGGPSIRCDAPEGSACRLVCAEDCGAEVWPCGGYDYDTDVERKPHPMCDGGYCNVVLFIEQDIDACAEVEGDPELLTYAGPVTARWDGDCYVWEPIASGRPEATP